MSLMKVYGRVLGLLAQNRKMLAMLVLGNLGVAALQFLDPLLFGRVIGLLAQTDKVPHATLFAQGFRLVALWVAIGACGILVNIFVAMGAERLAHRTRLGAISRCFDHVLALPASFHSSVQSGSVMKTMVSGVGLAVRAQPDLLQGKPGDLRGGAGAVAALGVPATGACRWCWWRWWRCSPA